MQCLHLSNPLPVSHPLYGAHSEREGTIFICNFLDGVRVQRREARGVCNGSAVWILVRKCSQVCRQFPRTWSTENIIICILDISPGKAMMNLAEVHRTGWPATDRLEWRDELRELRPRHQVGYGGCCYSSEPGQHC